MEAYEDLCDEIRSQKSATNSLDYLKTELVLMEFKEEIKQRYEKEKRDLWRGQREKEVKEHKKISITQPKPRLPYLFDPVGKPVVELKMYDVFLEIKRDELIEILHKHNVRNFTLTKFNYSPKSKMTTSKVHCSDLNTSCRLQLLSLLGKLEWKLFSKEQNKMFTGYYRFRPVTLQIPSKPTKKLNKVKFQETEFYYKIWSKPHIADTILKELDSEDQASIYIAFQRHRSVLSVKFKTIFDTAWLPFNGQQAITEITYTICN